MLRACSINCWLLAGGHSATPAMVTLLLTLLTSRVCCVVQVQLAQRDAMVEQLRSEVEHVRGELRMHQRDANALQQVTKTHLPVCSSRPFTQVR